MHANSLLASINPLNVLGGKAKFYVLHFTNLGGFSVSNLFMLIVGESKNESLCLVFKS